MDPLEVTHPDLTSCDVNQSESITEPKRLPSIIKPPQNQEPIRKEHSVRFSDEGREMISLFEQQKRDMENLLKEAREEYQSQLEELKNNQMQIMKETSVSTVNSSVSETGVVENILSGAERELAEIRAYQQKLLQKHSSSENSDLHKTGSQSIIQTGSEKILQSDHPVHGQSEASTSYHSIRSENHVGLPNFTPPTFHGTLLEETGVGNSGGIYSMEQNLRSEEEQLIQNQKDLEKLKALSENLERQMAGLTMSRFVI